ACGEARHPQSFNMSMCGTEADQSLCTFASAEIPRLRVDTELYIDDATQGYGPVTNAISNTITVPCADNGISSPAYLQLIGGSTGVQDGNCVVTTDEGREFFALEQVLPEAAVRRTKWSEDRNAMAVVDRTIQTLKRDLAGDVARHGGK
ncbi:unnamed protein product, partial [Symbiodinium microadriaticum]